MQRYISPQTLGILFEDEIHELLVKTKLQVLREKDIVRKYGSNLKGIDHMVYTDLYILCFQDKWTSTSPVLSTVNHFINCVETVSYKENKKCIGIYLTKISLTNPAKLAFSDANSRNRNLFIEIQSEDKKRLQYNLLDLLYSNQINIYESDDSVYMLPAQFEQY
jgi:hypothetical protein